MSTSISKSINHPSSGFNPHAPDPASECIVIRGKSISVQSYSSAKNLKMWKPHWWGTFLGTQKIVSWAAAFLLFSFLLLFFKMMNKCEFQGVCWKNKQQLKLQVLSYLRVTLSSGKLALSHLYFQKGIQEYNLIDISLSDASLGTQVHPLQAFTNEMASPNSEFSLVSIPLVHALLAVNARVRTENTKSVCMSLSMLFTLAVLETFSPSQACP